MSVSTAQTPVHDRAGLLAPLVVPLSHRVATERVAPVFRRDPETIRRHLTLISRLATYFSPEVLGLENLPESGPVLVVGNHSCLLYMPDAWVTGLSILRRRGIDEPEYTLIYDLLLAMPGIGSYLRRIGAIPAGGNEAEGALEQGAAVLVYPGGDLDACRPWTARDRVDFGGRKGFVRLALHCGVPVVPVVTHGSHNSVVVLARGEQIARVLGLGRIRVNVFPIVLGPFGVTSMLTPPLPMPTSMQIEFLPPIDWSSLGGDSATDRKTVEACYDEITGVMQSALDRLAAAHPHPVLSGLSRLIRRDFVHLEVPA